MGYGVVDGKQPPFVLLQLLTVSTHIVGTPVVVAAGVGVMREMTVVSVAVPSAHGGPVKDERGAGGEEACPVGLAAAVDGVHADECGGCSDGVVGDGVLLDLMVWSEHVGLVKVGKGSWTGTTSLAVVYQNLHNDRHPPRLTVYPKQIENRFNRPRRSCSPRVC